MDWAAIAVLALGAWVWRQSRRIETLTRELHALRTQIAAMSAPPLLLTKPLGADEPLLLDTPVPAVSNDTDKAAILAPLGVRAPHAAQSASALPFAALAMLAALAAPLAGAELRPPAATTLLVCIFAGAGFVFAAAQRWAWVAVATFAGLFAWFIAAIDAGDVSRALAVVSLAALGGVSLAFRRGESEAREGLSWLRLRADAPSIAVAVASVLTIWCWLAVAELQDAGVTRLAWVGAMLVALAAAAVRTRIVAPASFAVAVVSLAAGFVFFIGVRVQFPPLGENFYAAVLACAALVALAALYASPHRRSRVLVAVAGAFGSAVLVALAATTRDAWHGVEAWGALFIGGAALLACARRQDASAVAPWVGAGAALLMLGVESASPELWRSAAHAGVAAALALIFAARRWRSAGVAALIAGVIAIVYALGAFSAFAAADAFATSLIAAALLFAANRIAEEGEPRSPPALGLAVASTAAGLLALTLALRASGVGVSLFVVGLMLALVALAIWARKRWGVSASPSTSSG